MKVRGVFDSLDFDEGGGMKKPLPELGRPLAEWIQRNAIGLIGVTIAVTGMVLA